VVEEEDIMTRRLFSGVLSMALVVWPVAASKPVQAQDRGIFIPLLVYRTGPYAPNGIPFANGFNDYFTLINQRDGGINGVKIIWE
jgi:branched-chain amino acid transport system substrate-binding protein